jgi:hypothetical protein
MLPTVGNIIQEIWRRGVIPLRTCRKMKTHTKLGGCFRGLICGIGILASAQAQIYVTTFVAGKVEAYDFNGQTINSSLLSGLDSPLGIAVSGSDLFVSHANQGRIGLYTTSGGTTNASFITGLNLVGDIAVDGGFLYAFYLASNGEGRIGKFNAFDGSVVNADLVNPTGQWAVPPVTGLPARAIEVAGGNLFVLNWNWEQGSGWIGKYNLDGTPVNDFLITGLYEPRGLAASGSHLYVTDWSRVGKYGLDGTVVDASLITGLEATGGIVATETQLLVTSNQFPNGYVGAYDFDGSVIRQKFLGGSMHAPGGIAVALPDPPTPVPDSGTTASLIGIALASLAAFYRRHTRR